MDWLETSSIETNLESFTKSYLSTPFARTLRKFAIYPRYLLQAQICRNGYRKYGDKYPQKCIFIIGLPKSGTTWLEGMLIQYPGFNRIVLPDMINYEIDLGESHSYEFQSNLFERLKNMLAVVKVHSRSSNHNLTTLEMAGINYVIMFRDLRDVAVSYFFFVSQRPWHPEFPIYQGISIQDGLRIFGERSLESYMNWIKAWHENRDLTKSVEIRYEQMISDPVSIFFEVSKHFGLDQSPGDISSFVNKFRFNKSFGDNSVRDSVHYRKGIVGDWKNHFTPNLKELYKKMIGGFLIDFGYEQDLCW